MFIFASVFQQQDTITMSPPAGDAAVTAAPPTPTTNDKPKKKFQVVPVPGEFTRGRWKVIDTRFGSALGEFGNYPPDDEYKMMISCKNNVITVRKKFPRPTPPPESSVPSDGSEEADSIRVLQKSQPRFGQSSVHPTSQISIVIMDPEATATLAESERISVADTISTEFPLNNSDELTSMTNPSSRAGSTVPGDVTKIDDPAKLATATSNTVVAIDNKIVQAMDLVKTHLTFAVREEVETLRTTITDLEARLNALREENKLLRENVAPDVLAFITANKQVLE